MKISASIFAGTEESSMEKLIKQLDEHHVDYLHVDCDNNLQIFESIAQIRKISATPIDLHIMTSDPSPYWQGIEEFEIEFVTFQYEDLEEPIVKPDSCKSKIGLSVTSETPVQRFAAYESICDFILLMTTEPGVSGKPFQKENFKRIYQFRKQFPGKRIHVDGGINAEISFILRNLGVDCAVSGSFLVRHKSIGSAMLQLKSMEHNSAYRMEDFMIEMEDLPILKLEEASFAEAVKAMDQHGLGFCFYVNEKGRLAGITSNADLRKGIIRNLDDLSQIELGSIINDSPVTIQDDASIQDMLRLIKELNFIILFLPVVRADGSLCGAVTFNNLIRGE